MAFNLFAPQKPQPTGYTNMDQSRWAQLNKEAHAPAEKWAADTLQNLGVTDQNKPQTPIVSPYAAGTVVAQQPAPVQKPAPVNTAPQKTTPVYTGGSNNPQEAVDYLTSLYTSPQEEERLRKASVANQRIMAVGDALRHIGNIVNTVNYAPAQKFNSPVEEERKRYMQDKAIRDAHNYKYMTYQQAKAAQDAKIKQLEADRQQKAEQWNATYKFNAAKAAADLAERQRQYNQTYNLNIRKADDAKANAEARLKETTAYHNKMAGIAGMNAKTNRDRATAYINKLNSGGNASSTPLVTPNGSIHAPGKSIPQAQMNQLYKKGIDSGWIKQSEFQQKMREAGFGKADPDYVRNQMVVEAMMEHGDFADFARDNYGWKYGDNNSGGNNLSIGWDDEEEDNDGLSIGW